MTGVTLPSFLSPGAVVDRLTILRLKLGSVRNVALRRMVDLENRLMRDAWTGTRLPDHASHKAFQQLGQINGELWQLENKIRSCEQSQIFDWSFGAAVARIQRLNRQRAEIRTSFSDRVRVEFDIELIEVAVGLDTYADQVAIGQVKAERQGAAGGAGSEVLRSFWLAHGLDDIFCDPNFRQLQHANARLWAIKDDIDSVNCDSNDAAAIATFRSLYLVNDARYRLKHRLGVDLGSAFCEVKAYTPYNLPRGWDLRSLSWRA